MLSRCVPSKSSAETERRREQFLCMRRQSALEMHDSLPFQLQFTTAHTHDTVTRAKRVSLYEQKSESILFDCGMLAIPLTMANVVKLSLHNITKKNTQSTLSIITSITNVGFARQYISRYSRTRVAYGNATGYYSSPILTFPLTESFTINNIFFTTTTAPEDGIN